MEYKNEPIQSPHPALQAILPRLASLGTKNPERWKPVFRTRNEAEAFCETFAERHEDQNLAIQPVWAIDHTNLEESKIAGWSVTDSPS